MVFDSNVSPPHTDALSHILSRILGEYSPMESLAQSNVTMSLLAYNIIRIFSKTLPWLLTNEIIKDLATPSAYTVSPFGKDYALFSLWLILRY